MSSASASSISSARDTSHLAKLSLPNIFDIWDCFEFSFVHNDEKSRYY